MGSESFLHGNLFPPLFLYAVLSLDHIANLNHKYGEFSVHVNLLLPMYQNFVLISCGLSSLQITVSCSQTNILTVVDSKVAT